MSAKKTARQSKGLQKAKPKAKPKTRAKATPKKKPALKAKTTKQTSMNQVIAKFPTDKGGAKNALSSRRPPNNPELPADYIADMEESFRSWRDELEDYAAHLRSLDRKRLNGVGIKKLGFIGRALLLAAENSEFLPYYLSLRKFQADNQYFLSLRSVYDVMRQVQEMLWNVIIEASDVLYTDALEYYAGVREAAKRRVDPAETLYKDLSSFFKSRGSRMDEGTSAEPTQKQLKRDFNALQHGKRDGKIVIENIKPKVTAGVHKVIDQTFKDTARFKESEQGEIGE